MNWWKIQFKKSICRGLLLLSLLVAAASASPVKWNEITHNQISVFFTEPDLSYAQAIHGYLNETLPELTRVLTHAAPVQMEIFICPSQNIFEQFTGAHIPEWSEAICFSHQNQIILKSPNWSQSSRAFRATVLHEVTHLVLAQRVRLRPIPTWLNEGLAVHFSGERTLAALAAISKAQVTNSLIPLQEIDDVLRFQRNKALLAYQESYFAVQFLFQQFGAGSLPPLLDALQHDSDFETAFFTIYQMRFADFEQKWREHIRIKNRWDFMFDFSTFLWILMGFLFVLAVLRVFLKKRQRLREWEREESE
jgi:hypothetical protein